MKDSPDREVEVFTEALQLPVGERASYLDRACGDDVELRRKVDALLEGHNKVGDFLEDSAQKTWGHIRPAAGAGEKPGDRIGRFKLLQQIGEGGCGVVFMAEQEVPVRRRVALKIIKPGMDTKSVIARFEAERQALALMDHPNIARIFDAGATDSGRPYFVMELVRGTKITEYCDQHSLSTGERLKLFVQVCQAIQHAHQKGIIHRDIKPSNILVTTTGDGPLPVVIDFGIAKATTNQRLTDKTLFTAFEMLIGTPAYMSPEQAELTSADVDTRTDIYSLGVLLYELLTGSTPFDTNALLKAGLDEIRHVIRDQEPARPSTRLSKMTERDLTSIAQHRKSEPPTLIHAVCGDLDWITMKALEKDRARRYETAYGMALDIQRYLADEPVSARPPSKLYRLRKTFRRNKLLFGGIGVITVFLISSLIVVSASLAKERQSRLKAEAASAKSRQVTKFLENMLSSVGPSVALGQDVTLLRGILDRTAEGVGWEMTNQPAVEAELRDLLGRLYFEIGNYHQAEEMDRAALKINQKLFGRQSKEAAASLNNLGLALMDEHKLSEGEEVDGEALAIRRHLFGNEHADTATSLNDLSALYRQEGRYAEAEAMAREALATRQKLSGGLDNLTVADSLRNLSIILGDQNKWPEAEAMARDVLAMRRKLLGPEHPWVASSLNDVAWAAGARGKLEEAETLEREALTMRQKLLGAEHPEVARSLYLVGDRLRQRGNLNDACSILTAALSIQRKLLGEGNPDSIYTLRSLGSALEDAGRWSEAETVYREVLTFSRKTAGEEDPQTINALDKLSVALESQSKWPEAETVRREALAGWRKQAGIESPETLYKMRRLGATLEAEGKWAEAETLWRESLAAWRKLGGNEETQSMYTLRRLGLALEAENKWPDAEAVHREALAVSRKQGGNEHPEALSDLERLARVLMAEQKFDEAEKALNEVLTPAFARQPASQGLLGWRAGLLGRRGRWPEAAADAARLLLLQPNEHYNYHRLAALLAVTQNRPAYEQLCLRFFTAFTNLTDPFVDERLAQDCLLLPHSGVDLRLVDRLADASVKFGSGNESLPYFQACKAMSDYRLELFPEAIDWAEKVVKSPAAFAQAKAYAILAMANWQLGKKDTAQAMLAKGDGLAPNIADGAARDLGDSWVAWLMARISLDEAAALIQSGSTTNGRSNPP